ncbi:MAG: NAD(P)-dependent oxidoreductase, partial [Candidatus Latescibacteria bacterium]|nr:NAD(P)-dependent oxidoreductase [Candidatus Latescibacterota bacterium]
MKPRVLVDPGSWVDEAAEKSLGEIAERVPVEETLDEDGLIQALSGCTGLIKLGPQLPRLSARVLESAHDLRIVGLRSDRFGHGIDLETAARREVRVVDADNLSSAHPVAEWDLALILLCLRNAGAVYRQMMAGTDTWASAGNDDFVNGELTGRRVGLIGCGHVGQRLIELLAPFRVDLRVCDPYVSEDMVTRLGITRDDLGAVLDHADILVVQVPHTPKTEGLIGAAELERLGEGKILINCSRGKVMDQDALVARLQAGRLIAGLDVFDPEPLPSGHVLRSLSNVFCTPHIA